MPIYLYWGEDDYALEKAVQKLRATVLDPVWASFNYTQISGDRPDSLIEALNLAMTPPFGAGSRLVWLVNSPITQQAPATVVTELERTLTQIPDTSILLLTSAHKPDARLKTTKLLQEKASFQEFPLIPPWKTELLIQHVKQIAAEEHLKLTASAAQLLAEAVGNNTRLLYNEIHKLRLYQSDNRPLDTADIEALVASTTQNSLKLAEAISKGHTSNALELIIGLIARNEPALRIVATLVGQFRTWLWVKLLVNAGVKDEREIASAAEVSNPKRIFFLRQQVAALSLDQLLQTLPLLLQLELSLKQGADEILTLQSSIIQLCHLYQVKPSRFKKPWNSGIWMNFLELHRQKTVQNIYAIPRSLALLNRIMLNSSRFLTSTELNQMLSQSLLVTTLSTLGVLAGVIPSLSERFTLDWQTTAQAQSVNGEQASNFVRSILEIERTREATLRNIGASVAGVECDVSSGVVRNINSFPADARSPIQNFCKQSQGILQQNGLSASEFSQLRNAFSSNPRQYPQITSSFQQMCQDSRYSGLQICR